MKSSLYMITKLLLSVAMVKSFSSVAMATAPMVAAGFSHTLALKPDGTVWAWGDNSAGQLGDGTTIGRTIPGVVPGLSNIIAVCTGGTSGSYNVALKADGTVWAWGYNANGQLGDGTTATKYVPQMVAGLSNVKKISAGGTRVMALKGDGTIWAWGARGVYGLGDGVSGGNQLTPVHGFKWGDDNASIQSGGHHSMVLKADGTVWVLDGNIFDQYGFSTGSHYSDPVQIPGLSNVIEISSRVFTNFALLEDRTVVSWGMDMFGSTGQGTRTSLAPMPVAGLSGVESISAFGYGGFARTADGEVYSWGNNAFGQLGDGTNINRSVPVLASTMGSDVLSVSGGFHGCFAVKSNGDLYAVGRNATGELGIGSTVDQNTATLVGIDAMGDIQIVAGTSHSMAKKPNGELWVWGDASDGRLGHGAYGPEEPSPIQVTGISAVRRISTRSFTESMAHSVALTANGAAWGWGYNESNQTGAPVWDSAYNTPQQATYDGMLEIAAGSSSTLALDLNGRVWGWGYNGAYELALPALPYPNNYLPTATGITGIKAIAMGRQHSLALRADGKVLAWGRNLSGQLGRGTTSTSESVPAVVAGLSNVVAITAGEHHSTALRADGTVWTWGENSAGELGDATWTDSSSPIQVDVENVVAISSGKLVTLALHADGSVSTWGGAYWVPEAVPTSSVKLISSGTHGLLVRADGTFWSWGSNSAGQLGIGTISWGSYTPVQVDPF